MALLPTPDQIYARRARDYWHVREPLGRHFVPGSLGGYYIDLSAKARPYEGPMHEGIPMRKHIGTDFEVIPTTVTQLALAHFEVYAQSGEDSALREALRWADWLVEQFQPCEPWRPGWRWNIPHKRLRIRPPFISAMTQGQGISALVRAHQHSGEDRYLETAYAALEAFTEPVERGGVAAPLGPNACFFEEYPSLPRSHVLNGHIFAIWGLYDLAIARQDNQARALFDQGVAALRAQLGRYDLGFWSRYCLYPQPLPNVATPAYHELHTAQLRALHRLTGEPQFLARAQRWERQFGNWANWGLALGIKVLLRVWIKTRRAPAASLTVSQESSS